jgi:hypothetical protein
LGVLFFVLLLSSLGCATGRATTPRAPPPPPSPFQPQRREKVLEIARALVGAHSITLSGHRYRDDCTSLPLAAYGAAGVNLFTAAQPGDNGVTAIYRFAESQGRVYHGGWPVPGDLVFFRETYDQNRDGRIDGGDGLTHVGVVDSVGGDATVVIIHRVRRGVVRYRMNLNHPDQRTDPESGQPINDYLRSAARTPPSLLTGQLFAAYATVLDGAEPVASR